MINFIKGDSSFEVQFQNNPLYLKYGNMTFPKNALIMIIDKSNTATFRRSGTNDVFFSALISSIKFDNVQATKSNIDGLFADTCTGAIGGGGGDMSNYYTKTQTDALIGAVEDDVDVVSGAVDSCQSNFANYYTKTEVDNSEMAIVSALTELNDEMLEKATIVELTQAEYDALSGDTDPNTIYVISDAYPVDMQNYYTKSQTNSLFNNYYTKSEVDEALEDIDLSDYYTKTETDTLLNAKVSTTDFETTERATSAALNDLNTRLLAVDVEIGDIGRALEAINGV